MGRDYTYSELLAMQEEATQRVREMQRRAQLTAQRAQEELDRKKPASGPKEKAEPSPLPKAGDANGRDAREHMPLNRPPAPEGTPQQEKAGGDAGRFSFLDGEPQRMQPFSGKPHQQKHISMPVDFIQEKQEAPPAPREPAESAAQAPEGKAAPGRKFASPLNLLEGNSDQSLLLALMLLLNGEGADELLLLALLYIMM